MRKRVHVITGHFGSGKTEFSVNYVMDLKKELEKVAILDMDIANPYFRSRERQKQLEDLGIAIHFNTYGYDISEDLPAITATVRAPLENYDYETVVDVGGNDSGARILNQFKKYFVKEDSEMLAVINANRRDSDTLEKCMKQIEDIEVETGIKMDAMINNTHMLRETTPEDILKGFEMGEEIGRIKGIPVKFSTCEKHLIDALCEAAKAKGYDPVVLEGAGHDPEAEKNGGVEFAELGKAGKLYIYPIELQMRPTWLDVKF